MVIGDRGKTGILFIHPWTGLFGAETSLYLLIKYLNREIFHPVVVLPDKGPLWNRLQTLDLPLYKSTLRPWFETEDSVSGTLRWLTDLHERVLRIVDIVHNEDIKIIHSNASVILEGALAARWTGRPHICSVRNNPFAHTWVKSFIPLNSAHEILNSLSHAIVPVSNAIRDAVSPFVALTKLRVIYNGIEAESVQALPVHDSPDSAFHRAMSLREPRICSIGRVEPQKGFDLLIDAAAMVTADCPDAQFSIFGPIQDKLFYQGLLQQAGQLNLSDSLRFEGHTDRVQEELNATDLLVISSREEGLPRVALEAMLAGKPVVSTRCGGSEDIIVDGVTGYLVPLDDSRALADAILKIFKDPELARQMGIKGRERVLCHFDARHTTSQYEAIYHEILGGGAAGQAEDKNAESVLIEAILKTLEKHGEEFYAMVNQLRHLMHFEAKVKRTLAYRTYKATKNLVRKIRKNVQGSVSF